MASGLGFEEKASEEIAIAVSELASNLVKHAQQGQLTLTPLNANDRPGIRVESRDAGPGIADVERALADGVSTTGSLGYGLGTVNRLMDTFDIHSQPGAGTHIVCTRWQRAGLPRVSPSPLEFGAATRAHPAMRENGDSFVLKTWDASVLVGVIDGLGHGQFAHRAAETARQYVESHFDQPLDAIFRGTSRACRASRGVVMALARFDWGLEVGDWKLEVRDDETRRSLKSNFQSPRSNIQLTFASIGNIEARVFGNAAPVNLIVRRGVIGGHAPHVLVTTHHWEPRDLLVLHTDGLSSHWRWEDFPYLAQESATRTAQRLLQRLAKEDDDATVVVVKGKP